VLCPRGIVLGSAKLHDEHVAIERLDERSRLPPRSIVVKHSHGASRPAPRDVTGARFRTVYLTMTQLTYGTSRAALTTVDHRRCFARRVHSAVEQDPERIRHSPPPLRTTDNTRRKARPERSVVRACRSRHRPRRTADACRRGMRSSADCVGFRRHEFRHGGSFRSEWQSASSDRAPRRESVPSERNRPATGPDRFQAPLFHRLAMPERSAGEKTSSVAPKSLRRAA